jgi:hypothetical protein
MAPVVVTTVVSVAVAVSVALIVSTLIVSAAIIVVPCRSKDTASEQGGEDRKNEDKFHVGFSSRL